MRGSFVSVFLVSSGKAAAFAWPRVTSSSVSPFLQRSCSKTMSLRTNKATRPVSSRGGPPTVPRGGGSGSGPNGSTVPRGSAANSIFDNTPMFFGQSIIVGANVLGFLISLTTGSHLHVDLLGTGAFAAAALPTLMNKTLPDRVRLSSAAVLTWSSKLAAFLFYRILQNGHDGRLDDILAHPLYAAGFWTFSMAWGILCTLPHSLGTTSSAVGSPLALRLGCALFGLGLLTETTADYQKTAFKVANPGQFCDVGLWSLSQHPNWFGNMVLWSGIFLMNAPALIEPLSAKVGTMTVWKHMLRYKRVGLAFLSPIFMLYLFSGQANGSITESVAMSHHRYGYGTNADFTKYIDTTPLIFPNPLKWF
jgi:steroid 5-alpha reductase family enzyme